MRRHIIFFLLLCLHGLARGQTEGYNCYYWFDGQQGKPQTSPMVQGSFSVDVSALADGIHSFHFLATKNDGNISLPVHTYFLKATDDTPGQINCLCSIDGQLVHQGLLPAEGGLLHWNLKVSGLSEGLHQVQIDALKDDGALAASQHGYFAKVSEAEAIIKGYYWFDDETDARETPVTDGTFEVDASSLSDGFHQFHYYAMQANGVTARPSTNYFLKTAQVNPDDELTCICTVDGQLRHIEKLPQQGGVIHWNLDMQDLADGLHSIELQAVTPSGAVSTSYSSYFMRVASTEDLREMYCIYAIDGNTLSSKSNVVSQGGSFHFDLDLSELEEGLHYISFMLHSDRGTSTTPQLRFFVKTPIGGNGITRYQYWLNEEDFSTATTVTLPEKVTPLQLMTLLPIASRPLRSSQFHFDTSSGKPMIYARNTIHLRFYDAAHRFCDAAKDYNDYSVGQEVKPIKTLESDVQETTGWPEENEIKWYKVTAERGERLEFRLDHAATLQVFSPSGKEAHNVSGFESVNWNGMNAEENGTFYVALHDVTATQGETISIDYVHIDRYAVLRQDVSVIGNSGYSTITFEGNGFDDLTSVELIQGSNVISAAEIGHESKSTTSVKFDFSGATLGEYKAVFHFEEGELTIEKCVTVEEATPIELDVEAKFGQQYLLAFHKTKYVFSIHNYGNVTAYNVPLMIRIYTHTGESLERVDIEGYDLEKDFRDYLGAYYNDTVANVIKTLKGISGDKCFFAEADSSDIVAGWATHVHEAFVLPNIPPKTTIDISVNMQLGQGVYCYMWCPEDWYNETGSAGNSKLKRLAKGNECGKAAWWKIWSNHTYRCSSRAVWHKKEYRHGTPLGNPHEDPFPNEDCTDYKPYPLPCKFEKGGNSAPHGSHDPNDILGFIAESGSHALKEEQTDVYYTIEFENDTTLATAAAHEILVTDTLDAAKFDLSTYAPTRVTIGKRSADLAGDKNFVTTIDMRPEINVIAQVRGEYNQMKGIAKWHISSLDPMTMEPTDDVMQGVLPVNYNGNGIGEVSFNISLKAGLPDGADINNRASIIFDKNEAILTPIWTNIVDAVAPSSIIDNSWMLNDSTLRVTADAFDARSGVWKYEWYVQAGENAPWWKEGETFSPQFDYHIYEGIDYGFCVLATDSAGNVEQKVIQRERGFKTYGQDFEDRIDEANGQSSMVNGQSIYDLSGRRQAAPKENQINIIDKKKVLIR